MFSLPFFCNQQSVPADTFCSYCGRCIPQGTSARLTESRVFCASHAQTTAYSITTDACTFGNFALSFDETGFSITIDLDVLLEHRPDLGIGIISRLPITILDETRAFCMEIFHSNIPIGNELPEYNSDLPSIAAGTQPDWLCYRQNKTQKSKYTLYAQFPTYGVLQKSTRLHRSSSQLESLNMGPPDKRFWSTKLQESKEKISKEFLPIHYVYTDVTACQMNSKWPIYLATPPQGASLPGCSFISINIYCSYLPSVFQPLHSSSTKAYILRADLAKNLMNTYPPTDVITEEFSVILGKYLCQIAARVVYPYKYQNTANTEEAIKNFFLSNRKSPNHKPPSGIDKGVTFGSLLNSRPTGSEVIVYVSGGLETQSYNQKKDKITTSYMRSYLCLNQYIISYAAERFRLHRLITSKPELLSSLTQDLSVTSTEMKLLTTALGPPSQLIMCKVFYECYKKVGGNCAPFQLQTWNSANNFYNINVSLLANDGSIIDKVIETCDQHNTEKSDVLTTEESSSIQPSTVIFTSIVNLTSLYDKLLGSDDQQDDAPSAQFSTTTSQLGERSLADMTSIAGNMDDEDTGTDSYRVFAGLIGHCSLRPMFPTIWLAYRISFPKSDAMEKLLTAVGASFLSTLGNTSGEFVRGSNTSPYYASLRGRTISTSGAATSGTAISSFNILAISLADDVVDSKQIGAHGGLIEENGPARMGGSRVVSAIYDILQTSTVPDGSKKYIGSLGDNITIDALDRIYPQDYSRSLYYSEPSVPVVTKPKHLFAPTSTPNNFKIDEHLVESTCLGYGDFINIDAVKRILDANHACLSSRLFLCEQNGQKIFERVQSNHRRPSQ
ncbi:Hypothetical protein GLP15_117 [Giardia lamblia P15]|uniref:Uncharacterized protein n=1 Tax=Giardia intestinalis (strain P15) TaxID=658858 RepID=E1EX05_GIAIA|nr:Hypothetical protein GLP15_117 [Giardia lamblia P15]